MPHFKGEILFSNFYTAIYLNLLKGVFKTLIYAMSTLHFYNFI